MTKAKRKRDSEWETEGERSASDFSCSEPTSELRLWPLPLPRSRFSRFVAAAVDSSGARFL